MRPDLHDPDSSVSGSSRWRADVAGVLVSLLLVFAVAQSMAWAQSPEQKAALAEAARLNAEGVKLYRAGKYSEADPLYRRSLGIVETVLGPEHPNVAGSVVPI